jgi:hypothetical protein
MTGGGPEDTLSSVSSPALDRAEDGLTGIRVSSAPPEEEEPAGWQSWTNGNFVHTLALQGTVLWAGTGGGAVRWDLDRGSYDKYLAPDGLGDGSVRAVAPESSGVTWLGSFGGGLAAFDDGSWTAFSTRDGLLYTRLRAIEVQQGVLWIGSDRGLNAFDDGDTPADKSDDTWTTFRQSDGLSFVNLRSIGIDSSGRKWLGAFAGGLNVLDDSGTPHDKSDDQWNSFTEVDGLADSSVYAVVVDPQDNVWCATSGGLSVLDHRGTPFDKSDDVWASFRPIDGLTNDMLNDLALDSQQRLWVATHGGGLFVLDHGSTPFDKSDDAWTNFRTEDGLASDAVCALALEESGGRAWAGSCDGGISQLEFGTTLEDKGDDTWTTLITSDPLPDNYVDPILPAGEHVWLGTVGGGLCATDGELWTTYTVADGLISSNVYALVSQDDILWVGTGAGISSFGHGDTPYDPTDDTWTSFRPPDGLNSSHVESLTLDGQGRLWAASSPKWSSGDYVGGGLSVLDDGSTPFDKSDDTWMTYTPEDSGGVFNAWALQIHVDPDQRLWAATYPFWQEGGYVGGGLVLLDYGTTPFDKSDDVWTVFTTTHGLSSNTVHAMAADASGVLWVGTDSGVNALDHGGTPFDTSDDAWTLYDSSDGLASNITYGLSIDGAGRLWVATGYGVTVLDSRGTPHDKSDDTVRTYRVADGLVDHHIHSAVADASGAVWVGTRSGLSRLREGPLFRLYLPLSTRGQATATAQQPPDAANHTSRGATSRE